MNEILKDFKEKLRTILEEPEQTNREKEESLLQLLSVMANDFDIPLVISEDFINNNQCILEVFNEIRTSIAKNTD